MYCSFICMHARSLQYTYMKNKNQYSYIISNKNSSYAFKEYVATFWRPRYVFHRPPFAQHIQAPHIPIKLCCTAHVIELNIMVNWWFGSVSKNILTRPAARKTFKYTQHQPQRYTIISYHPKSRERLLLLQKQDWLLISPSILLTWVLTILCLFTF